jgi:hypothetical protein|mmetsp:Transcript_31006/g.50205  ORF Transcript_31006/g.50205 Transcript_31006/m.50205 type:complete len:107 (+) Transcript_31006:1110-1430(+)
MVWQADFLKNRANNKLLYWFDVDASSSSSGGAKACKATSTNNDIGVSPPLILVHHGLSEGLPAVPAEFGCWGDASTPKRSVCDGVLVRFINWLGIFIAFGIPKQRS